MQTQRQVAFEKLVIFLKVDPHLSTPSIPRTVITLMTNKYPHEDLKSTQSVEAEMS